MHATMKSRLFPVLTVLGVFSALLATPASAAGPERKLAGHWISFADSSRGTHQPGDVIMLTFNRAGAFAWQDTRRSFTGGYSATEDRLQLTDGTTGETIPYTYRFHRDYLIIEAQDRLTITFIETRQGAAAAEAILARAPKTKPVPAPAEPPPARTAKVSPDAVKPVPAKEPEPKRTAVRRSESALKAEARRNLEAIYAAIQAYRRDHKDLPAQLSDLVPQYLPAQILQGPAGLPASPLRFGLEDPKLPTPYIYEFSGRPVPASLGGGAAQTMKQWRQQVMSLVGGGTPLVRCPMDDAVLNLSFDGEIYESGADWTVLPRFSDKVNREQLMPRR
jgi:hypothetical protein